MALQLKRKASEQDTELQMAPMIDCVFLLLIFFMVSAVMRVPPPFGFPTLPESSTRHEFPRKKYNIFISADGRMAVDEQEMYSLDELDMFLSAHENQITTLIIKADKRTEHGIVIDIMERAKRRFTKPEGQEIALAVSEDE
ncbi:biopolymer transporter ExbD [Candidatus Poribacteria bacterium]|nr:biopolymer transporter ExbD [Candidatus Poribacteria bacterium]